MFKQILFVQWRSGRLVLLPLVLAAFGLPLLSVQGMGAVGGDLTGVPVRWLLDRMELWLPLYPTLALALGTGMGIAAWSWDQQVKHVYALALPVPRWEYALLKMAAGVLMLLVPVGALWAGGLVATASVDLPAGLNAYPTALAVRFLFASLVSYGALFALASGTVRTVIIFFTGLVVLFVGGEVVADLVTHFTMTGEPFSLTDWIFQHLVTWPGPAQMFSGSWMLIDV